MSPDKKKLLAEIRIFVTDIFYKEINDRFLFHNIHHTRNVVSSAKKIADNYKLNNGDYFALMAACWFHDTGFSWGIIEDHENKSKSVAQFFLKQRVPEPTIKKILSCIDATRLPQVPKNTIERIICDADLYHLGTAKFKTCSNTLKREKEIYFKKKISDSEWLNADIAFLETHKYFTKYCQKHLEPIKQKWLRKLQLLTELNQKKT